MADRNQTGAWRVSQQIAAADTTQESNFLLRESDRRAFVDFVAARNRTRAASTCQVGIKTGGYFYPLASLTLTTGNTWYPAQVQTWLYEGETLCFAFASVVAADILDAAAVGHREFET